MLMLHSVSGGNSTDALKLVSDLFSPNNYNPVVRPVINQLEPTMVTAELTIVGFNDLDEVKQKLAVTGYLKLTWQDQLLTWSPADYGHLTHLDVPQSMIWKPDLALKNGFTKLTELGSSFVLARVENTGSVIWSPYEVFEVKCDVDIQFFPFDQQRCYLKFIAWSTSKREVFIQSRTRGLSLEVTSNAEWDIVSSRTEEVNDKLETEVWFSLLLRRKPLYTVFNIMLPVILLSFLNLFVFVLPADCGEKMSYAVTLFLSFAVFLTIINGSLPDSSESIPTLSLFLMLQLTSGCVSIIITAFQLRINFQDENRPVPKFLKCMVNITRFSFYKNKCFTKVKKIKPEKENEIEKDKTTPVEETQEKEITWKDVSSAIDFIMFWVFLMFILISTIVAFRLANIGGQIEPTSSTISNNNRNAP
ncbi:hypothetical protein KUTeg_013594 [Tegillarca granosa]|uniref:Uncharacterized protein n=1 Tax=Tegillarca granosa TaxID=220873 RepID=A0ABQ9EU71_TEGGR|nr:hypothetical protein KUTeg_013594 [Tegillarca granosa]